MGSKMMEDLLNCGDHLDVTIVCEDGEIKSSKFVLSARSEYFAIMFKSDTFKESSGRVTMCCKKKVMEKVIEHLYGGEFNPTTLKPDEKLHLLNMLRMMMLHDVSAILEDSFMRDVVCQFNYTGDIGSISKYVDILDLALSLNLDFISENMVLRLGLFLPNIMDTVIREEFVLPTAVLLALAHFEGADVFARFRLINHFKDTIFVDGNTPHLNLKALTIDQLEKNVAPSGLYNAMDVLQIIIAKQKTVIISQKNIIAKQKSIMGQRLYLVPTSQLM